MTPLFRLLACCLTAALALCGGARAQSFPPPDRPVAPIVSDQFSDEASRDAAGEAERTLALLGVRPGLAVADIGAGRGYYTLRLARALGPTGRVIATDIDPQTLEALRRRARREGARTVETVLGAADDPRLAPASVDLVLMVRMYHEIAQPYALLWRLRDALKPGGRVAILEGDKAIARHGTPPRLLRCELAAVGYREVALHTLPGPEPAYLAVFAPSDPRPAPEAIAPCRQ